jgi:hypothetical protein
MMNGPTRNRASCSAQIACDGRSLRRTIDETQRTVGETNAQQKVSDVSLPDATLSRHSHRSLTMDSQATALMTSWLQ